jgi:hypothetical protein
MYERMKKRKREKVKKKKGEKEKRTKSPFLDSQPWGTAKRRPTKNRSAIKNAPD